MMLLQLASSPSAISTRMITNTLLFTLLLLLLLLLLALFVLPIPPK